MLLIVQVLKEKWFWITGFAHSQQQQQKNLWMKLPTIPPGFSEPIRLQDSADCARSQAQKKLTSHKFDKYLERRY